MKQPSLQQVRSAAAVVECGFSVSRAAKFLHTSQPAVSKTLKALEDDLGTPVFVRAAGRIVGLSEFGQEILGYVNGILHNSAAVLERARAKKQESRDTIRIAANHTYLRYQMSSVIRAYLDDHPGATVHLQEGDPEQVAQLVAIGRAQVGLSTQLAEASVGVLAVPAFSVERCLITPLDHELLTQTSLTLEDLTRYPLISYHDVFNAADPTLDLSHQSGHSESVIVESTHPDVIKAYVRAGLGIAVMQRIAIEPEDEGKLGIIDASHLFPPIIAYVIVRRDRNLRSSAHDFIEKFAPNWMR